MTIDELIESLKEAKDEHGGDAEVQLAYQPNYPLTTQLDAVTVFDSELMGEEGEAPPGPRTIIYLAAGLSTGYGSSWMWAGNLSDW